ncbi:MAG: hypothetical protein K6E86_06110 [Bacteroidales bacterium]|nr:hypothetical protein [Bacteroidales bacterium]
MKSWKGFILAVSLLLSQPMTVWACGYWDDHATYNLFRCVEPLPDAHAERLNESVQFWSGYTGIPVDDQDLRWDVSYLSLASFEAPENNRLLHHLTEHRDTQALAFLRLNTQLEHYQHAANSWDYEPVTPQQYEALLEQIEALQVPQALTERLVFLRLRCLFQLQRYDQCLALWNDVASHWADTPLRRRFEGYVAGVHFARGEYALATDMYFRLGDDESIGMCVNRLLNVSDAETEFRRDPNSLLLGYLLEDYANYYYHAVANDIVHQNASDYPLWHKVWSDSRRMEQFALRVAREDKVRDRKMWQAFAGFLQLVRGESRKAEATFAVAEQLPGNDIVHSLLRHYRLMAQLDTHRPDTEFDQYLGGEIRYYRRGRFGNALEESVLANLYSYELSNRITRYIRRKSNPVLPLFFAQSVYGDWRFNPVLEMSQCMTTEQVRQVREVVDTQQCPDSLIAALLPAVTVTTGCVNEVLGTKLLREGRFAEAADFLSMVSQNYQNSLGIAPYLASRQLSSVPFRRKNYKYPTESVLRRNAKVEYCQQVLQLQQQISACSDQHQRHELQYRLADLYFQASPAGDLWAISEYAMSSTDSLCNGLNLLADTLIHQILSETTDVSMQTYCYYALAANPASGAVPAFAYDFESSEFRLTASRGDALNAYSWLRQHRDNSHPVYKSCDWLGLYVTERK